MCWRMFKYQRPVGASVGAVDRTRADVDGYAIAEQGSECFACAVVRVPLVFQSATALVGLFIEEENSSHLPCSYSIRLLIAS